jgi:hypothetical protein
MALARMGANAESMAAAVAPVAARINSRRLHEIARSIPLLDAKSQARENSASFSNRGS